MSRYITDTIIGDVKLEKRVDEETDFGDNSIIYIYDRVYCELNRTDN